MKVIYEVESWDDIPWTMKNEIQSAISRANHLGLQDEAVLTVQFTDDNKIELVTTKDKKNV